MHSGESPFFIPHYISNFSRYMKIAISSTYRPGFSARWSQRVLSMIGVILRCRPTEAKGDLALPTKRKFLRIFVMERSLHYATFTICDVVSLILLHIISTIILRCQDSIFFAILLVGLVGCSYWVGRSVNKRRHGGWGWASGKGFIFRYGKVDI